MWFAVPWRAMLTSTDSFAGVAARVMARTFEYESSPFSNASAISGRFSSARHAHLLARGAGLNPALPVQPLRRVREPVAYETLLAIELGDQHQKSIRRGVQIAPELGDFVFQFFELALPGAGRGHGGQDGGFIEISR